MFGFLLVLKVVLSASIEKFPTICVVVYEPVLKTYESVAVIILSVYSFGFSQFE